MRYGIVGLDRYVENNPNYGKRFTINNKETYARVIISWKGLEKEMMQKYKIDYLTQGQNIGEESLQKSCYVLEARLNNPFIKGVEQYKRIVICRK